MHRRLIYFFLLLGLVAGPLRAGVELIPASVGATAMPKEASADAQQTRAAFTSGEFAGAAGRALGYRLFAPPGRVVGERYPLVIWLHGSGAVGVDNDAQLGGLARSWAQADVTQRFPAFVLAPQFPQRSANYHVSKVDGLLASEPSDAVADLLTLVDRMIATQPIDPARIYIMGFSMGASTGWHLVNLRPHFFAAAILFSGIPPERSLAARLTDIPLLLVHGNADVENPIAPDRAMISALEKSGARAVRFREYEQMNHTIPAEFHDRTPAGDAWRQWLFSQKR